MDYGEHEEVQEVHAAIQREKREPRVGLEPLSIWLVVLYGFAIFFGGAYLGRYSGDFSGTGLDPMGGPPPSKKRTLRKVRRTTAGTFAARPRQKDFSRPTVRLAIKPTVSACLASIRRSLAPRLSLADRAVRPWLCSRACKVRSR